jgi:hypothetical protein
MPPAFLHAAVRGAHVANAAPHGFGTRALAAQLSERTLAGPKFDAQKRNRKPSHPNRQPHSERIRQFCIIRSEEP